MSSNDKIWEILLAFMLQTIKKEIPAIESGGLGGSDDVLLTTLMT